MKFPEVLRVPLVKTLKWMGITVNRKWMMRLGTPAFITVVLHNEKKFKMKGTGLSLENSLYWKGFKEGHEPMTAQTFIEYARDANWVLDIGANTGFFALMAKTINPQAKVAAFEPHPFFYELLVENAKCNNYQITTVNEAASHVSDRVAFFFPKPNQGNVYSGSVSRSHFYNHQDTTPETIEISTIPLDNFIAAQKGWGSGGLVKIDAEGHDEEVLMGLQQTIMEHAPVLIVEIQSQEKAKSVAGHAFLQNYTFRGIHDKKGVLTEILNIPFYAGCDNYLFIPGKN